MEMKWQRGPMTVAIMAKMAINIAKGYFQSGDSRAGMGAQAAKRPGELALQGAGACHLLWL